MTAKNRKDTDELHTALKKAASLEAFLAENESGFIDSDFSRMLESVFAEKHVSKATLAKRSGMSEVYLHQLFAGKRNPSRNRLISLCVGMGTTVEECQELLRRSGHAMLYPRSRRDAISGQ